ncbi:DNA primase [Methylophaga thalassica]|uniref:DNA primase n=1 Tax=Methylophaga thalassica TaxID=40223 RepID=UPI002E7BC829|nr:DNA primase [Methylophaga thalassica]WVI85587.1 DNA primase [Methylophaga thalassica]
MAGQIPPQFIDELLARVDIVDIIDTRVALKKAGKNLHACCPFHNEKTPSFTVSPDKQFYHCFGCGAHGTAIGFLMEYDQLSFPEAIQELADQVGMTVPTTQNVSQSPQQKNLYDLMDKVSQFYVHQLQTHPERQIFVDYIKSRGLSKNTIEMFGIGMAPDGWDNVLKTFGSSQTLVKQLLDTGLLIKNDAGRIYDRFRHRLMFPIRDRRGRVIGFGGRVLDDSTPKYLNSPETPIFHKGTELYGLYQARKQNRKLERILIVEGYMDVIALAEHGITNAVATLGTATTPDHLRQLLRTAPEVVFCFDGDRAGREAAWRAAENALPMLGGNQQLKFMFLPDGEDPDSMVRRHGAEAFESEVLHAQNYSEFFFAWLTEKVELGSMDGRARLVEIAKPFLKHVPAGVYRDMLEQRLAELSQTNMATLNRHIEKPAQKQQRPAKKQTMATMTPLRLAISILLQYPILAREIDDTSSISSLDLPGVNILKELLETLHEHPHLTTAALLERWRNRENGAHLQKLALQSLSLSADELKYELLGIFSQLQKQAKQQRRIYLESKPLSELTETEKAELRLSQS